MGYSKLPQRLKPVSSVEAAGGVKCADPEGGLLGQDCHWSGWTGGDLFVKQLIAQVLGVTSYRSLLAAPMSPGRFPTNRLIEIRGGADAWCLILSPGL